MRHSENANAPSAATAPMPGQRITGKLTAPGFDFDDGGDAQQRPGDIDPDPRGGIRRKADRALDQVVAGDAAQRYPGRTIPSLDREIGDAIHAEGQARSEEHTSELQSLRHLVCRLLLEKNNIEVDLHPARGRAGGGP